MTEQTEREKLVEVIRETMWRQTFAPDEHPMVIERQKDNWPDDWERTLPTAKGVLLAIEAAGARWHDWIDTHARALLSDGWMPIESAPSEGRVWVFGGRRTEPELVLADGEHWRHMRDHQLSMSGPTHWHTFYIPPPPEPHND